MTADGSTLPVMSEPIWARATINLPGIRAGTVELVNPDSPYVAKRLKHQHLVPIVAPVEPGEETIEEPSAGLEV